MRDNKENLMAMNLQFFAEDEGAEGASVETAEVAEQPEAEATEVTNETAETEGVTEEAAEPQFDTGKANAAFANMRRQLEAAERKQRDIDAMYAEKFGQYVNPETGQPIKSAEDYAEAMAAQDRMNARKALSEANIDPNLIDNMIKNSPAIKAAEAATAELNSIKASKMMEEDFKTVLSFDHTKSSVEDIVNDPSYQTVVDYVSRVPGMRFSEAYKLVNFDRLTSSNTAAAKQAVINQVKGQSHLANGGGLTSPSVGEDIPAKMLDDFKELFPDKSMKELRELYNKTLSNRR